MESIGEKFREEYTLWIKSAAKDIAFAWSQLKPDESRKIISQCEKYLEEPGTAYGRDGFEMVRKLAPENILLLSTDAVVFSQSIFVRMPGIFDYAVALNRKYYLGSWYSIITFNSMYLNEASEVMLRYTLEHEMLQKEVYEENILRSGRRFSPEEKRKISDDALKKSIEKSGITKEELEKEDRLMQRISCISPLIPKPFAETALYRYMKNHLEELRGYGEASRTEEEDRLGKKLNSDFNEWIEFSMNTYKLFLADVKNELNYGDYGYA